MRHIWGPWLSGRVAAVGAVAATCLAAAGCTPDWAKSNNASVELVITDVTSTSGSGQGTGGDVLNSDVRDSSGTIFNDTAALTVEVIMKDPNPDLTTGSVNDVLLQRYEVVYFRSDGQNVEGVDVPYRISGPIAGDVPPGGSTTVSIDVVRHQAKLEPPLLNLTFVGGDRGFAGGAEVLTCIAEITIHGTTRSGQAVQAMARLQINFADFGG
jgi:hypothetical protein